MLIKTISNIHDERLYQQRNRNLTPKKTYEVIGLDFDYYRVVDDICEPILFPKEIFDVVDDSVPRDWLRRDFPEGRYYIDPPELSGIRFYDDFFDGKLEAVKTFKDYVISHGIVAEPEWWEVVRNNPSYWAKEYVKAHS